ncbi:PAQR family membrane homeostasis protein TrhA [Hutsoniella sourekii]|uniref:PAQR family membrane homeostasis protein TrhA n=1 Tax=Hutsoniella sourekii TaxID=87650 RepID=UPI0004BC627F|nr:hemolysin III family protein [Hutsoniella sourekii]
MSAKSERTVFSNPTILSSKVYQVSQEVFNAVSHGIGFCLSLLALYLLIRKGLASGQLVDLLAYLVYGISMSLLFFHSMLYHSLSLTAVGPIFQMIDHLSIYLLIAGTYTPFALLVVGGAAGWLLLLAQWAMAILGCIAKLSQWSWMKKYSTRLYLLMGWMVIFTIKPLIESFALPGLCWLVSGGILYSLGAYFYSQDDRYAYFHVIWHWFVLFAAICMFVSIYVYI